MIGTIINGCIKDILLSLSNNKRYNFNPDGLYKVADMDIQTKMKFKRNLQMLSNNMKVKNILKQLEKEINNGMNK